MQIENSMLRYSNNWLLFLFFFISCNHPLNTTALLKKAVDKIQKKDYDNAYNDLNTLIYNDSTCAEAYWLRGQILDLKGKDKSLVCQDLKRSAALGFQKAKESYEYYCGDKIIDKYNEQLKQFEKYIATYPDKFEGYYDRANLNFDYDSLEKAIEDYSKVLTITEYPVAYYNRGLAYLKLGQKDKGCPDVRKAIDLGYKKAEEALHFCQ